MPITDIKQILDDIFNNQDEKYTKNNSNTGNNQNANQDKTNQG